MSQWAVVAPSRVDVRVIAATNRDLEEAVRAGRFRSDLFYRLNVFPIQVPPLRERRSDIPLLVMFFLSRFARKLGKKIEAVPQGIMDLLTAYDWPGNIRELQNLIERAVVLSQGPVLRLDRALLPAVASDAVTMPPETVGDVRPSLSETGRTGFHPRPRCLRKLCLSKRSKGAIFWGC